MMATSDWTPQRRLDLIKQKSEKAMSLMRDGSVISRLNAIFHLLDEVYRLSYADAQFLEDNKDRFAGE